MKVLMNEYIRIYLARRRRRKCVLTIKISIRNTVFCSKLNTEISKISGYLPAVGETIPPPQNRPYPHTWWNSVGWAPICDIRSHTLARVSVRLSDAEVSDCSQILFLTRFWIVHGRCTIAMVIGNLNSRWHGRICMLESDFQGLPNTYWNN